MKIKIKKTECTVKCAGFYQTGAICLDAIDKNGEPFLCITTNIPGHWKEVWRGTPTENQYPQFPYIVIKDYSENEGITKLMLEQKLITGEARIAQCDGMFRLAKMSDELAQSVAKDVVKHTTKAKWNVFTVDALISKEAASEFQGYLGYHPAGYGMYEFNHSEGKTTWSCSNTCD